MNLLRKELRSLLPFVWLLVFLAVISAIMELFEVPYSDTLDKLLSDLSATENSASWFIIVLAMTTGLLIREYDQRTLEFMDSLPLSRTRIFFTKCLAVLVVLLGMTLVMWCVEILFLKLGDDSFTDGRRHWTALLVAIGLDLIRMYVMVGIGILLSFFRRFGWLAAGMVYLLYRLVHPHVPELETVNIFRLTDIQVVAQTIVIPWPMIAAQVVLGTICYLISWWLFHSADRMVHGYRNLSLTRFGSAFLILGSIGIGITVFGILLLIGMDQETSETPEVSSTTAVYTDWGLSRASSDHFRFSYRSSLSERATKLIAASDEVHDKVVEFFQTSSGPPIVVDATSKMQRHAGMAEWNTVILDLNTSGEMENLKAVLGHETAHVFIDRLTDAKLRNIFSSIRFFHEGLASYVEFHKFDPSSDIENYYRTCAYMRDNENIEFEQLVNDGEFRRWQDTNAVYPVGLVFIEALLEQYGPDSINKVLSAMNREKMPEDLVGMAYWRDVMQAAGFNLDTVIGAFYSRLDELVDDRREWLDSVPQLKGAVRQNEWWLCIIPILQKMDDQPVELAETDEEAEQSADQDVGKGTGNADDEEGADGEEDEAVSEAEMAGQSGDWQVFCRFRQRASSPDSHYRNVRIDEDGEFCVDKSDYPGNVVWYQLGLRHDDGTRLYKRWREVSLHE